ncbi:unnamed protein product [Spodoptera exigua]|nr:unnamed protein product [Spodoptera exigua]
MEVLIVFAGLIALSAGSANPWSPGDNSVYVEGVTRFIWMPDGEGNPHLVDLHEPQERFFIKTPVNNEYWLYTRKNPKNAQKLVYGNVKSITKSNYKAKRGLNVIVHGWWGNGNSSMNSLITSAFLAVQDVNVIVVDWRALANSFYLFATLAVPDVGQSLGKFLVWLIRKGGGDWKKVHLVGFSLGAHVVGNAGRQTGGRPARVTERRTAQGTPEGVRAEALTVRSTAAGPLRISPGEEQSLGRCTLGTDNNLLASGRVEDYYCPELTSAGAAASAPSTKSISKARNDQDSNSLFQEEGSLEHRIGSGRRRDIDSDQLQHMGQGYEENYWSIIVITSLANSENYIDVLKDVMKMC